MSNQKPGLKKELNSWDCTAIILGVMIGTGIFSVFPSLVAQQNISIALIILTWIIGGLFAWFGAMCYAELSSILPHAGGDYTYIQTAYSVKGESLVSFLFAWSQVLVIRPSSIAVLALIFGYEIDKIMANTGAVIPYSPLLIALFITGVLTFFNMVGIEISKHFQNAISCLKIGILLFIIIYGVSKFAHIQSPIGPFFIPENKNAWGIISGFWSALVLTMWVYGGWNEAAYIAEEAKSPYKDIPRALFIGIASVMALYIGINIVYMRFFTPQVLATNFNTASDLMTIWFGKKGGVVMSCIIAISAAGAINALTMTGARMSYAVAKDFDTLRVLSVLHPKHRTPIMALMANFIITAILLALTKGNILFVENLTFYTAGVYWYFFAIVIIGLFMLRKQIPSEKIPFKLPMYPYLPILFLLVTISLIWGSVKFKPFETLAGISILNLGIPLYYFLSIRKPDDLRKNFASEKI